MKLPHLLQSVIDQLEHEPAVEAIVLASSDYELNIYLTQELPVQRRAEILAPVTTILELNNLWSETKDIGVLSDGTEVELVYRNLTRFRTQLQSSMLRFEATLGYSTRAWANVVDSRALFDRGGEFRAFQKELDVPYAHDLTKAIVSKNWSMLGESSLGLRAHVKRALLARDWVSVQHRCTAFLASVFDVVFAVNQVRNPGEKRLLERSLRLAELPKDFEPLVNAVAGPKGSDPAYQLTSLEALATSLGTWLEAKGLLGSNPTTPRRQTAPALEMVARRVGTHLTVYTDGGCIGNPGKGAWAFLVEDGTTTLEGSSGEPLTTNNKMELQAVIEALKAISEREDWKGLSVVIHTDSQYVRNGITTWIKSWEANGWKTAAKEPVKNKELWLSLQAWDRALAPQWKWVKGHAGNPRNERCDALVRQTMDKIQP